MALRYAIARPERVAAIGIVAGNLSRRVQPRVPPPSPVPMFQIIGDADPFLPMDGGEVSAFGHTWQEAAAISTPQRWAAWHGAPSGAEGMVVEDNDGRLVREWPAQGSAAVARWMVIHGHGHDWPGASSPLAAGVFGPIHPRGIDATAELWRWMRRHRRLS
jgi:polyhydroxybutyrate depolymerase